jgi:hypothetical protein
VPGHYGAIASGELTLCEATIAVAWNVQGDPARPALVDAAQRLFGVALPAAPNTAGAQYGYDVLPPRPVRF